MKDQGLPLCRRDLQAIGRNTAFMVESVESAKNGSVVDDEYSNHETLSLRDFIRDRLPM
jgi:hypothetical protein